MYTMINFTFKWSNIIIGDDNNDIIKCELDIFIFIKYNRNFYLETESAKRNLVWPLFLQSWSKYTFRTRQSK